MEYTPRLKKKYNSEIINNLMKNYKSVMQVPKLTKISINQGVGNSANDKKLIEAAQQEMTLIAGQKAVLTKSRKDISNFKLRKGMPVGVSVTLRRQEAYDFLYKLIHVVYPRVRDFRGVGRTIFDAEGNCSFGFKDHTVFPEVGIPEDSRKVHEIEVTVVTTTKNPEHTEKLLEAFGFPLKKLNTPSS